MRLFQLFEARRDNPQQLTIDFDVKPEPPVSEPTYYQDTDRARLVGPYPSRLDAALAFLCFVNPQQNTYFASRILDADIAKHTILAIESGDMGDGRDWRVVRAKKPDGRPLVAAWQSQGFTGELTPEYVLDETRKWLIEHEKLWR